MYLKSVDQSLKAFKKFLKFNTLLQIFIPIYIPSDKPGKFKHILDIYPTKVIVMFVGRGYCTYTHAQ
jgi:hypothetical protein